MSPRQKNINAIHSCEEYFYNWLKIRLVEEGISIDDQFYLSDLLINHEKDLTVLKQHLKPLQRWNRMKDECYNHSKILNGNVEKDELFARLIEKTAFEGQILWLTLKED